MYNWIVLQSISYEIRLSTKSHLLNYLDPAKGRIKSFLSYTNFFLFPYTLSWGKPQALFRTMSSRADVVPDKYFVCSKKSEKRTINFEFT